MTEVFKQNENGKVQFYRAEVLRMQKTLEHKLGNAFTTDHVNEQVLGTVEKKSVKKFTETIVSVSLKISDFLCFFLSKVLSYLGDMQYDKFIFKVYSKSLAISCSEPF